MDRPEGSPIASQNRVQRLLALAACALIATVACATDPWQLALSEDTSAAYHSYLRKHPRSEHMAEARERIAFDKVRRTPTVANLEAFLAKYPDSAFPAEIRAELEPDAFAEARAAGTTVAYDDFLGQFPNGRFSARARGNAAFLAAAGFGGRPAELGTFAGEHPESDFAAEAERSARSLDVRERTRFRQIELVIEVDPATPEMSRLEQLFAKRAFETYRGTGIALERRGAPGTAGGSTAAATLTIRHSERPEAAAKPGEFSRPGIVATTQVILKGGEEERPIWQREFSMRIEERDHRPDRSLLYAPSAPRYWAEFFVPVASWSSQVSVRDAVALSKPVAAVDAVGDRAVVLFADGDFKLIELADPTEPVVMAEYDRSEDLTRWTDVRIVGGRIVMFGEDGLEVVGFGARGPERVIARTRADVGAVHALAAHGKHLLVAGPRGMQILDPATGGSKVLLQKSLRALAVDGSLVLFADHSALYVTTVAQLQKNRVLAQLRVGPGALRIRTFGGSAAVIGESSSMLLDLSDPANPRVASRIHKDQTGPVFDATRVKGRIFLIGERGLMALDRSGANVVEAVDVRPRQRIATMGRHMVAVGGEELQVVDATPFTSRAAAAAPGP